MMTQLLDTTESMTKYKAIVNRAAAGKTTGADREALPLLVLTLKLTPADVEADVAAVKEESRLVGIVGDEENRHRAAVASTTILVEAREAGKKQLADLEAKLQAELRVMEATHHDVDALYSEAIQANRLLRLVRGNNARLFGQ
jgi:hypothetical protein